MLCAECGESTPGSPCSVCAAEPRLEGRYALLSVLGRGAQGTTFRATGTGGDEVAVKELPVGRAADDKQRARLAREAAVLGELSHPAIPRLHETFFAGVGRARSLYVVQDLVEGQDLEDWIEGHRSSEAEVVEIMRALCAVLGWLHTRSPPVVHRDLKPANVLRTEDGRLFLVDFGSVRAALRDPVVGGSTVAGTFGYMAPEQLVGEASPRSDLYGLGALAIRLLTRRDPAGLLDRAGRMQWREHAAVSPGLGALLDALVAPDAEDRPASAEEVLRRLDAPADDPQGTAAPSMAIVPRSAAPLVVADAPALAERVGGLLAESLGSPGRLVRDGEGWRWVSLHGRVEVGLRPTAGGLVAEPRIARKALIVAAGLATVAALASVGGAAASVVLGGLVLKKAIGLGVVMLMMSGALVAGPLGGWSARRRRVRGALRAAGPEVRLLGDADRGDPETP
jgi:hypothetical protein